MWDLNDCHVVVGMLHFARMIFEIMRSRNTPLSLPPETKSKGRKNDDGWLLTSEYLGMMQLFVSICSTWLDCSGMRALS